MPLIELVKILRTICGDVYPQGGAPEKYPERFFTYWNGDSADQKHYDNKPHGTAWAVDVNFYAKDPLVVLETLEEARIKLQAAGWKITGKGYSVPSDDRAYTGRGFEARFLET